MKKTLKIFSFVLVIMLVSNIIIPIISLANNDITEVEVTIYEDEDRIITTKMPKNLAENKIYLDYIVSTQIQPMLKELEKPLGGCSLELRKVLIQPFFVTPEQPKTPDRKLLKPCKTWTLSDVKSRVGVPAWTKYVNVLTMRGSEAGLAALLAHKGISGRKAMIAALPLLFLDIYVSFVNAHDKYWSENLYLLETRKIKAIRQCIYENLKGDYPKVFNIIERVKW